jgi:hypothetical protein
MPNNKFAEKWNPRRLYDIYEVEIQIRDKICGGTPYDPKVIAAWIRARTGHDDAVTTGQIEQAVKLSPKEEAEAKLEGSWNGFPQDENGLFVWARQIKAMFRESATMLKVTTEKRGSKQVIQHGFEIKAMPGTQTSRIAVKDEGGELLSPSSDRIYLGRTKPDELDEGPIHVQTAQGPRNALKRVDYVSRARLAFEVWVFGTAPAETRHLGQDDIEEMLLFAQENGLGADRSQGQGKFNVLKCERVSTAEKRGK